MGIENTPFVVRTPNKPFFSTIKRLLLILFHSFNSEALKSTGKYPDLNELAFKNICHEHFRNRPARLKAQQQNSTRNENELTVEEDREDSDCGWGYL